MSFSSKTKEELSKMNNLTNKELVQAEFMGYLISNNTTINDEKIKYSTESEYNINRFSKLLNNMEILDYQIEMIGKNFAISFKNHNIENLLKTEKNKLYIIDIKEDEEYIKALIRGIFLGSGSMNNPENKYHLEISLSTEESAVFIYNIIAKMDIKMKFLKNT